MNILVSCDKNYINPLKTMIYSLFLCHETDINIYIIHSSIEDVDIKELDKFIDFVSKGKGHLINLKIEDEFKEALTTFYYTSEMYYRLIAYKYLPADMDRILYLDPDILVLNDLTDLYNQSFDDKLFMAAIHTMPTVQSANKARLKITSESKDINRYYNSGILMVNLKRARVLDYEAVIIEYINTTSKAGLLMPDQDLLNVVFKDEIKEISELKYNYDARRYQHYNLSYNYDLKKVVAETSILHFCGKRKPWNESYVGKFNSLYQYIWQKMIQASV